MSTETPRVIAVFSDIHGNLHALNAVLERIDGLGIDTLICCGDVIGYGAFPNECCQAMIDRNIPTLAGNHDHAAIGRTDIKFFNEIAKAAVKWTCDKLTPENAKWLEERPFTCELGEEFYFAHASPYQPERWGYVLTFGDARTGFEQFQHLFCFIGHSHQPAIVIKNGEDLSCPNEDINKIQIKEGERYLINVGSVGQPRDHNPQACFVTVNLDEKSVAFHRVAYDIDAAQKAILDNDLPPELAERIGYGW